MIRNLYYLTLANNGSVLNRLIDSAEEEEYKETHAGVLLPLAAPLGEQGRNPGRWIGSTDQIEAFLKIGLTGVEINFEVADALGKLFRLGLARPGRSRDDFMRLSIDRSSGPRQSRSSLG